MSRMVDTPYGPMPGCPDCGIIKLRGEPHICEHGVTSPPVYEVSVTATFADREAWKWLIGLDDKEAA